MLAIFDSGVGGLTIWRALKEKNPQQPILYFADTLHLPYGEKCPTEIVDLSLRGVERLVQEGATQIILGCHTMATHLSPAMLQSFPCTFYSIAEAAVAQARFSRNLSVITTKATYLSCYYQTRLENTLLAVVPCPELASLIEKGKATKSRIQKALSLVPKETETLLYGCTHFPFIDSYVSFPVRMDPASFLVERLPPLSPLGEDLFLVTSAPERFYKRTHLLLERNLSSNFCVKSLSYSVVE